MYKPLTKEQYQSAINSGFSPAEVIEMEKKRKELTEDKPGYFESVSEDYKRIAGEITSGIQKGAEQVEKGGLNIIGGLARGALRTVGGVAEAAFSPIVEAPGIKQGLEAIGTGISKIPGIENVAEKLTSITKKYPELAKDAQDIVDILALGGGRAVEKPVGKALTKAGKTVEKSGAKSAQTLKSKTALELVRPIETKASKLAEVARTKEVGGLLKKDIVVPSRGEVSMAKFIEEIPGISEKNTFQKNFNVVRDYNLEQAKQLKKDIAKYDFVISRKEVLSKLNKAATELEKSPLVVGDAAKTAKRLIEGAKKIVNENKGSGSGLLKARKEYDAWVKKQKPKVFDAASENALTISNNAIRDTINAILDDKAVNLGVKDSLRKQSSLFRAMENIAPKAMEEANTQFGRLMQNVGKTLGTKNKIVQGIAAAAGIGGLGAAATFAPAAAALGGTGFVIYRAGKLVMNPKVRIKLGELLLKYGHKLNPKDKATIKELFNKYKEGVKDIPSSQEGYQKIPGLRNRKQGGTFQSLEDIKKIDAETAKRQAKIDKGLKGKSETSITTDIAKAKAEGKSFRQWTKTFYNDDVPLEIPDDLNSALKNKEAKKIWLDMVEEKNVDIMKLELPETHQTIKEPGRRIIEPIIINKDGLVFDGHNRIKQAIANGDKEIKAKIVPFRGEFEAQLKNIWDK